MGPQELIQVVWEATYKCPSKCLFCYNCWKHDYDNSPEMDLDSFKTILSKLPNFKRFVFSGGEPLLRTDLEELIIDAEKYTDNITVLTSGILITDEVAQMFKKHNIFVQIPFHGLEKTHNKLTGLKNGYKKAIIGVAFLKKYDVRFAITSVANRKNVHELKEVFELGVALGAKELQVIRFMPGGAGMKNVDLMLNGSEYIMMLDALNEVCSKYRIFGASGAPNIYCKYPDENYKNIKLGNCSAGIDWIVIDPSGRIRICNHSPTILGNLLNQNFNEIWQHPILKKFRTNKLIPKECNECDKKFECRGGCRAVAETYYGDLSAPDPLMLIE
jgi:radical SAM protein with 4Fe4S-binding SPASM domain